MSIIYNMEVIIYFYVRCNNCICIFCIYLYILHGNNGYHNAWYFLSQLNYDCNVLYIKWCHLGGGGLRFLN